ncbi:MAG: signal peptide peptidase SppA [Terrimicrobiaceae bacterium]|nr:signal peptide peptidase SppA [Terrimicrobiaceae bacterium]
MKKSGCAILILFLALCASMFGNLLLVGALGVKATPPLGAAGIARERRFEEVSLQPGRSASRIAVIPLEGIIMSGQSSTLGGDLPADFRQALAQAREDAAVKAVVVSVDSPGGEITASDTLFHALREFSKVKPAVVYMNSLGASGAYYAACGGSEILCNPTTFTGSIGVIISTLNYRELFGKVGLEAVVFKSGKFKDMLSGARELTEEERAYVQGLVAQSYERFLEVVAGARKLAPEALRSGVADGRILSGTDAKQAGLVDGLGYIEDAYERARELASAPDAVVVRYRRAVGLSDLFWLLGEARAPRVRLEIAGLPETRLEPGRVYLLPAIFAP